MRKIAAVGVLVLLGIAVAAASAFGSSMPKLNGTDGPGFTISLKAAGKNVKVLKKGKYALTVNDKSSIHNFVIEGPGVEKDVTTVSGTGNRTVTLKLRAGKYKFYCKPHESSMFGFFTVK